MGDDRAFVDDEPVFIVERRAFMADVPLLIGDEPPFISDDTEVIADEAALVAQERTKVLDERALLGHERAALDEERVLLADRSSSLEDERAIVVDCRCAMGCGGCRRASAPYCGRAHGLHAQRAVWLSLRVVGANARRLAVTRYVASCSKLPPRCTPLRSPSRACPVARLRAIALVESERRSY